MIKKALTVTLLITFLTVGAFGFMFMMHEGGVMESENCPIGTALAECPVSIFAHLNAWRGITFDFSQIISLVALLVTAFIFAKRVQIYILLEHKIRDWISKKISELQFLYSLLFSSGILHAKITPDITY